jgi:hypothetical protein
VCKGANSTVLIQLAEKPTKAEDIAFRYRIVPYVEP